MLRECSQPSEAERRLARPAVDALLEADLFRCVAPAAVGGLEADPLTQIEIFEAVARGGMPDENRATRMRMSATYATEVAVEVAHFAYRAAGTAALFETSPLQRALRDVLAAGQHIFVRDTGYVDLARARMESAAKKHAARERDPS